MKTFPSLRTMRARRLVRLTAALLSLVSCSLSRRWVPVSESHQPNSPRVLLLQSANNPVYEPVRDAAVAQLEDVATVYTYDLEEGVFGLRQSIARLKPDLLLTLGTRATDFASEQLPGIPLVFTMVVDYQRLGPIHSRLATGVAMEVSPSTEFSQFKLVLPNLKRVLAFYTPGQSADLVNDAQKRLRGLDIELTAVPIRAGGDIPSKLETSLKGMDAIWMLNDPSLLTPEVFAALRAAALAHHLPLLASFSDQFARGGGFASLSVDLRTLGFQVSALAVQVLQGAAPAELGVQSPIGSKLVVNQKTAQAIGVKIPADSLPFVELVGTPVSR